MYATDDNGVFDEHMFSCISQYAKPTVTLAHLRTYSTAMMDANEMKMALGRLWRSLKVFRKTIVTNGQVLYWTEATARAVAASGIEPDMPPGVEIPEIAKLPFQWKAENPKSAVPPTNILPSEQEAAKPRRSGLLVPPSASASLPMRPEVHGLQGNLRRNSITGRVAMAMFKYRDVRLSIDGATILCPGISRNDVARVISQLSTANIGKNYFRRFDGATRRDSTYQWNPEYSYPFALRCPDDGANVPMMNVEKVEDTQPLDHLPPDQLSEEEVDNELARLFSKTVLVPEETVTADTPVEVTTSEEASTVNNEEEAMSAEAVCSNVVTSIEFKQPARKPDTSFRAGLFSGGELIVHTEHGVQEFTPEQTNILINLLGPHFLARKAA